MCISIETRGCLVSWIVCTSIRSLMLISPGFVCASVTSRTSLFYIRCPQMRHRTAFLATPPEMWLFLVVLGLFTSFAMCVYKCSVHIPLSPLSV